MFLEIKLSNLHVGHSGGTATEKSKNYKYHFSPRGWNNTVITKKFVIRNGNKGHTVILLPLAKTPLSTGATLPCNTMDALNTIGSI